MDNRHEYVELSDEEAPRSINGTVVPGWVADRAQ